MDSKKIHLFSTFSLDFDGDGQPDDINFMIKRIKVHTDQALNEASYRFPGNYGVEKFLELFSGMKFGRYAPPHPSLTNDGPAVYCVAV